MIIVVVAIVEMVVLIAVLVITAADKVVGIQHRWTISIHRKVHHDSLYFP